MSSDHFYNNPIDVVEDVIHSKKWSFSRADEHEIVADINAQWCQYRLYFSCSEQIKAINSWHYRKMTWSKRGLF